MSFAFPSPTILGLALALGASSAAAAADAPAADPVVARVDATVLHRSDIDAARQTLPPQAQQLPMERLYPLLLDRLVDGALVAEAGHKAHFDQDPEVQRQLQRDSDQLVGAAYLRRAIDKATTEAALKAQYQTFLKEHPPEEEVHARHILVKTEDEAKSVIAQLEKGTDFQALAKKYSTDPGGAAGGDLGYFGRDDMVPEFAKAAFATPVGQYTKTPVKTQFGWHVIEVLDHRTKPPPTFDQAKPELHNMIARDVIADQIAGLKKGAKIETFGIDGKPLPPPEYLETPHKH